MTIDIQHLVTAARMAGEFMKGTEDRSSTDKTNVKDFVTVADIKSQDIIRKYLAETYPGVVVLSEEDDETSRAALYEPTFTGFVLDLIDGTYNFKRDMRESAISIGYVEGGESVAGVIYDPYKDEMFAATKDGGATRNGAAIHVSGYQELRGASVATSNGYDDAAAVRNFQRQIAIFGQTGVMPWASCPGSAVLVLAWIACGRVDAIHHTGFKPWDNAAGILIVREAGGVVFKLGGGAEARFVDKEILAGTPEIVAQLQAAFAKLDPALLA